MILLITHEIFVIIDEHFINLINIIVTLAVMPPDHNSDFDDHLSRGLQELHTLQEDIAVSVFVIYSSKNIPSLADLDKLVHPGTIIEDLRAAGFKVWVKNVLLGSNAYYLHA